VFSGEWQSLAETCGSDPEEFATLFQDTLPGRWPCSVGGRLLEVNRAPLGDGRALILLEPLDASRAAALLDVLRGGRKTLLCTSSGRLLSMSSLAPEEMDRSAKTLQSLFDPGSRPAVQAALKACSGKGRVDEFLASSGSPRGGRENWIVHMESLPAPGRLILCDLSAPSLALVNTGGASDSLLYTIIEENPTPALVVDKSGLITRLNGAARELAGRIYGRNDILGTYFWKWVAEEYREEAKANHDKRVRGYFAPSRYSLGLKPGLGEASPLMEISVFPLAEGGDSVAFMSRRLDAPEGCSVPKTAVEALQRSPENPDALLRLLMDTTGARSAAMVTPGGTVTSGSADHLMKGIPPDLKDRIWAQSQEHWSLYQPVVREGIRGMLALGGLKTNTLPPCGETALKLAFLHPGFSGAGGEHSRARTVLQNVSRLTALARRGREGMEKAIRELASLCGADRAVKAEISSDGNMLIPVASSGIQGDLPGFPLNSDSIMTWVSVHGRSAFLADPIRDVRMSAVFPDSGGEIAAPVTRGEIVSGVVLLATSSQDGFKGEALALLETAAGIFSALEQTQVPGFQEPRQSIIPGDLPESAVSEIDHRLNSSSAALLHASRRLSMNTAEDGERDELVKIIAESAGCVAESSSLLTGWLRAAAFGGKPDMQWLGPGAIVQEVVSRFRESPSSSGAELLLQEETQGFIACFDPSWLQIALNSLIRTAMDISGAGDTVRVSLAGGSGFWSVQVECSGRGIPAEAIPELFKGQGSGTPGQPPPSNALDLPLAKRLTEAMGGTITVFSSRDRGTRFTLRFKSR
jgi:PAS domain S-box-containing protein